MTLIVPDAELSHPSTSPRFVRRLIRRPLAIVCLAYLSVLIVIAIAAPMLMPHAGIERAGDLGAALQGPSAAHPLGVDSLGRDVLQRLLVGTRVTLIGVAEALAVVLVLGIPLGLVAGYVGGRVDRVITWVADLVLSLPAIILGHVADLHHQPPRAPPGHGADHRARLPSRGYCTAGADRPGLPRPDCRPT
jgi:peptide/nickel transport system permease protein